MSKRKKRCEVLIKTLEKIVAYPSADEPRGDAQGYPTEFTYDEFAYKRMVDGYREAIRKAIKTAEKESKKK